MRLEIDMPEHQYNNIMAIDSMSLGRAPYKGIIMYAINAIKHGRVLKQEPTTKNNLGVQMTNGEKLIETFPSIGLYKKAHDGIQINFNSVWFNAEYKEPTTKNDLGVDCISREQAKAAIRDKFKDLPSRVEINTILNELPSVTPQEPQTFKWCTDCREYDQEKHCCHRWSKVIRDTVEEMKQEYIEREVLDKIRAEIKALSNANPSYWHSGDVVDRDDVLEILDKYKADKEK